MVVLLAVWIALVPQAAQTRQGQQGQDPELESIRRGGLTTEVTLPSNDGKKVTIRYYPQTPMPSASLKRLAELREGEAVAFDRSAAIRLRTETNLAFGDTIVKTGNAAPGHPGLYSLWLRRSRDGWRLVFNSDADVWGTHHDPAHDVAEVPLESRGRDKPSDKLELELLPDPAGAVLRIAWGAFEWTARCAAARAEQ